MKKITVVTISYNCVNEIEKTIQSVVNQTYDSIEYIIIDGGSNDGTKDIIMKYQKEISYWISEQDEGVYYAMNKGIEKATGEWTIFMNAGDVFFNNTVLFDVFNNSNYSSNDVIYGGVEYDYGFTRRIELPKSLNLLKFHMCFSHQSTFVRTLLLKKYKFDESFRIIADFVLIRSLYNAKYRFKEIPYIISTYENKNGISSAPSIYHLRKHLTELERIGVEISRLSAYMKFYLKKIIHKILPTQLLILIYKRR